MKNFMPFFDFQGLVFGILLTSLGVTFLHAGGLVTGQTAGIALLVSYVAPVSFGLVFALIGAPFLVLAWIKRGPVFAARTLCAVVGISVVSQVMQSQVSFAVLPTLWAAILGGACAGIGLIATFRHNASAGGTTILGVIIEQQTGFKAGWFQLLVDGVVFGSSFFVLSSQELIYSVLGAAITNMMLVWNFEIGQSGTGGPRKAK